VHKRHAHTTAAVLLIVTFVLLPSPVQACSYAHETLDEWYADSEIIVRAYPISSTYHEGEYWDTSYYLVTMGARAYWKDTREEYPATFQIRAYTGMCAAPIWADGDWFITVDYIGEDGIPVDCGGWETGRFNMPYGTAHFLRYLGEPVVVGTAPSTLSSIKAKF
jgi:hypothetical protein